MEIEVLKSKNGCRLLKYPSGTFGIEYSDSSYGAGLRYTDNYKEAVKFFNKVSADTSSLSLEDIRNQAKYQLKTNMKKNYEMSAAEYKRYVVKKAIKEVSKTVCANFEIPMSVLNKLDFDNRLRKKPVKASYDYVYNLMHEMIRNHEI